MRYSLQDEYGYSGTIRYVRIAGVRILYGRIICGRRIFFELQYGTSTVRVQSYKFEYSTSKRRGLQYSYGTVPALFTIRFGRAETVPVLVRVRARGILFEIQYGTRTVQYSTIAYFLQDLEEQKRTKYKINGTVAYSYKYKQERGLSTVHCGTVPVPL